MKEQCLLFTFSSELYSRKLLDVYLSRALNVDLEDGRLTPIDDSEYVLTLDFTIKMLNIHERLVMSAFFREMWFFNHGLLYVARTCTLQYSLLVKWQLVSLFLRFLPTLHRYHCGMPVIIEGETGVGKTALLEMLSKLWNHAPVLEWKRQYRDLLDFMRMEFMRIKLSTEVSDKYQVCHN